MPRMDPGPSQPHVQGILDSIFRGKLARAWSWPLTSV